VACRCASSRVAGLCTRPSLASLPSFRLLAKQQEHQCQRREKEETQDHPWQCLWKIWRVWAVSVLGVLPLRHFRQGNQPPRSHLPAPYLLILRVSLNSKRQMPRSVGMGLLTSWAGRKWLLLSTAFIIASVLPLQTTKLIATQPKQRRSCWDLVYLSSMRLMSHFL